MLESIGQYTHNNPNERRQKEIKFHEMKRQKSILRIDRREQSGEVGGNILDFYIFYPRFIP